MIAAAFTAVVGTVPLAIGVLVFQGPVGWQTASSHYALVLAEIIALVTAVVFGVRIACFGHVSGKLPAEMAARAHHGRYLTAADFDSRSRALLRRAQDAIDAVTSSAVYRDGLVDEPAVHAALTELEGRHLDMLARTAADEQASPRSRPCRRTPAPSTSRSASGASSHPRRRACLTVTTRARSRPF